MMGKERETNQPIRVVTWGEYEFMLEKLATKIKEGMFPNEKQKILYGIPRGGLIVATCLTHINTDFILVLDFPTKIFHTLNCRYLIVDDIVDSGVTAEPYTDRSEVATLFYREGALFEPQYYVEKLDSDVWIKFPWERIA